MYAFAEDRPHPLGVWIEGFERAVEAAVPDVEGQATNLFSKSKWAFLGDTSWKLYSLDTVGRFIIFISSALKKWVGFPFSNPLVDQRCLNQWLVMSPRTRRSPSHRRRRNTRSPSRRLHPHGWGWFPAETRLPTVGTDIKKTKQGTKEI